VSYRVEVGRQDGVSPREIVGAIANETGLDGRYIGRITIRDDHAFVDLPDRLPPAVFEHLQRIHVCGKPLRPTRAEGADRVGGRDEGRGRRAAPARFGGAGKGGRTGSPPGEGFRSRPKRSD
ncbi:DbpA RNA binding domain-containing protein, partial [Thioalkalicoccus limnaeus]